MAVRGNSLVVGTSGASLFRRSLTDAGAPWQPFRTGIPLNIAWNTSALASKGPVAFLYRSLDDGRTWRQIEEIRGVQAFDVAVYRDRLYLARLDGLWALPLDEIPE